jgi:hypothetical protein
VPGAVRDLRAATKAIKGEDPLVLKALSKACLDLAGQVAAEGRLAYVQYVYSMHVHVLCLCIDACIVVIIGIEGFLFKLLLVLKI